MKKNEKNSTIKSKKLAYNAKRTFINSDCIVIFCQKNFFKTNVIILLLAVIYLRTNLWEIPILGKLMELVSEIFIRLSLIWVFTHVLKL